MAYCTRCEGETGVEDVPLAAFRAGTVSEPKCKGRYMSDYGERLEGLFHRRCLTDLRRGYEVASIPQDGAADGMPCPLCVSEAD